MKETYYKVTFAVLYQVIWMSGTKAKNSTRDTIGIIGLGDMGTNIAETLRKNGFPIAVFNRTPERTKFFMDVEGVHVAEDLKGLVSHVHSHSENPIIWMMVSPDNPTKEMVVKLSDHVKRGDIVVDGSNSKYQNSIDNYKDLGKIGVSYLDVGVAGGPNDVGRYVALMVGGDEKAFETARPVFKAIASNSSYQYLGESGAGHMAKGASNVIFYSIFPIFAESLELMARQNDVKLDIAGAMRIFSESPHIIDAIPRAMYDMLRNGSLEGQPPKTPTISKMVENMRDLAKRSGVSIESINSVLDGYPRMSDDSKEYMTNAKRIITGH